MNSCKVTKAH